MAETRFPEFKLMDNEDFHCPQKRQKFLEPMEGFNELLYMARTRKVSFESMCSLPVLKKEQEQHLFRQYNCLKFTANLLRNRGEQGELARLHERVQEVLDVLFMCNIRLGVSHLKRHKITAPDQLDSRFSDVCESVIRAINKFNYSFGFKFSTYASWAIITNFKRSIPAEQDSRLVYTDEYPVEPRYEPDPDENLVEKERMELIDDLLICLDEREKDIIRSYTLCHKKQSFVVLSQRLGITRQRVQQIRMKAMVLLKERASTHYPNLIGAI